MIIKNINNHCRLEEFGPEQVEQVPGTFPSAWHFANKDAPTDSSTDIFKTGPCYSTGVMQNAA